MNNIIISIPNSRKVVNSDPLFLSQLFNQQPMHDVVTIIPVSNKVKNSDLLKFSELLDSNVDTNFCLAISSDSNSLSYLKLLENRYPNTLSIISFNSRFTYTELVRLCVNHCIRENSYKYFGITFLDELVSPEVLSQQVSLLKCEKKLAISFFRKGENNFYVKKIREKIIKCYAKYYLNFDLKEFSIKNCIMSREFALQVYKKPFYANSFYELVFLNRFSDFIYGQLDC